MDIHKHVNIIYKYTCMSFSIYKIIGTRLLCIVGYELMYSSASEGLWPHIHNFIIKKNNLSMSAVKSSI